MQEPIKIGGVEVEPGQQRIINLPAASLYTHTEMTMPVKVIHGRQPGCRLFVSAAVHGDEINGVEVIRRLLKLKLLKRLRGTLIAVPVVNVYGFISHSRYLPDRRDLNRSFPGLKSGSLTSRLAKLFMQEVVDNCTHGIDLHTGSNYRSNLPQIRACLDKPETERMADAFGAPVILNANLRDGSLRQAVVEKGMPMLLYEGGGALRFNEVAIRAGVRGIVSVMREIRMLPKQKSGKPGFEPLIARSSTWVRASESGILHTTTALGTQVKKGDMLGVITDPFGEKDAEVVSHATGIVIGRVNLPLVNEGDALFHIARVDGTLTNDDTLEAFQAELDLDFEALGDAPLLGPTPMTSPYA